MRRSACFLLFVSIALWGCGSQTSSGAAGGKAATVEKGIEVPLVLLRQIEAGSTREGTLVPFMVAEDVRNRAGDIVIEKGAIAEGEVTWSRSEGMLSGMMRNPARLEVAIKRTRAPGGETIALVSVPDDPEKNFGFTRANTGLPDARIDNQRNDLTVRVQESIDEFFETGDASSLDAREEVREWVRRMAAENGMSDLRQKMDGSTSDLEKVVRNVRDGSITGLTGPEMVLALNAVVELGRLAHSVSRSIESKLKGRTIKAFVGTPAKAFVASDTTVHAKA